MRPYGDLALDKQYLMLHKWSSTSKWALKTFIFVRVYPDERSKFCTCLAGTLTRQSLSLRVRVIENDRGMEIIYVLRHERRINTLTTPIICCQENRTLLGSALHCDISHSASGINPPVRNFRCGLENAANYRPLF